MVKGTFTCEVVADDPEALDITIGDISERIDRDFMAGVKERVEEFLGREVHIKITFKEPKDV